MYIWYNFISIYCCLFVCVYGDLVGLYMRVMVDEYIKNVVCFCGFDFISFIMFFVNRNCTRSARIDFRRNFLRRSNVVEACVAG